LGAAEILENARGDPDAGRGECGAKERVDVNAAIRE
jgi:hypothetical protein